MHMAVDPRTKLPKPPPEWVPPLPNVEKGEPMFSDVDNPGEWHELIFTEKMEKGTHNHHCLLTGTVPVVPSDHGERRVNGWKFKYQG
jgi:hypothetical protein